MFKDNNAGCFVCHIFKSGNASKLKETLQTGDQLTAINEISTYKKTANEVYSSLSGASIDRKEVQLTFLRFVGELTEVNTFYSDPDPSIQQMRSDDENTFDGLDAEMEDIVVFEAEDKVDEQKVAREQKEIIVKVKSKQFKCDENPETIESQSSCSVVELDEYIPQPTEEKEKDEAVAKPDEDQNSVKLDIENASVEVNKIEQEEQIDAVPSVETEERKSSHSLESTQDSITVTSSQGSPKSISSEKENVKDVIKKKGLKKKLFSLFKRKGK